MNTDRLRQLCEKWRVEARRFAKLGQEPAARMAAAYADELDAALHDWQVEVLTLAEAAAESGYSVSRLQHMVADGDVPNAGEKGAPRVRRCDLPRKAGNGGTRAMGDGEPDLAGEVLSRRLG